MQPPDADTRELLRAHLAVAGLTPDEAHIEALMTVYAGVLNGVRRIAALDLGETEPAIILSRPRHNEGMEATP